MIKPTSITSAPKTVTRKRLVGFVYIIFFSEKSYQAPAGDCRNFPENIKQNQVAGENYTHHGADKKDNHQIVFVLVFVMADISERIKDYD